MSAEAKHQLMFLELPNIPLTYALSQIGRTCERSVINEIFYAKPELVDVTIDILYNAY